MTATYSRQATHLLAKQVYRYHQSHRTRLQLTLLSILAAIIALDVYW